MTIASTSASVGSQPENEALRLAPGAAFRDEVPDDVAGDSHQRRLRERDHAAVRGEEDQAGRGDPEDEASG